MRALVFSAFSLVLVLATGCSKAGDTVLTAKQAGTDAARLKGQKVKVKGVYTQGFSKGGRPTDPWALVIGDAPGVQPTVSCVIPAKVDLSSKYPKITAEGTVSVEAGGRVYLTDCTYKLD